jgi:hypothetical protein
MRSVIMLIVITLNMAIFSVIMFVVKADCYYTEYHYAQYYAEYNHAIRHYPECHYALSLCRVSSC